MQRIYRNKCVENKENVSGKPHYLLVKNMEDAIAKHRAKRTFAHAESQTSFAALCVHSMMCPSCLSCKNKWHLYWHISLCLALFYFIFFLFITA